MTGTRTQNRLVAIQHQEALVDIISKYDHINTAVLYDKYSKRFKKNGSLSKYRYYIRRLAKQKRIIGSGNGRDRGFGVIV